MPFSKMAKLFFHNSCSAVDTADVAKRMSAGCVRDTTINKQVQFNIQAVEQSHHQNTFFLSLHSSSLVHVVHPHLIADVSESFEHLSQLI